MGKALDAAAKIYMQKRKGSGNHPAEDVQAILSAYLNQAVKPLEWRKVDECLYMLRQDGESYQCSSEGDGIWCAELYRMDSIIFYQYAADKEEAMRICDAHHRSNVLSMLETEDEMAYVITNDETGREFTFSSEEAFEAAQDWYNSTSKADILEYCTAHAVDLVEPTDDPYFTNGQKLVDDWHEVAMELCAKSATETK